MAIEYVCCFCGGNIEKSDVAAVGIALSNLWQAAATQGLAAHSKCIGEVFPAKAMVDAGNLKD